MDEILNGDIDGIEVLIHLLLTTNINIVISTLLYDLMISHNR